MTGVIFWALEASPGAAPEAFFHVEEPRPEAFSGLWGLPRSALSLKISAENSRLGWRVASCNLQQRSNLFFGRAWLKRRHGAKMEWRPRKRHRMAPFKWDKLASVLAVFGAPSILAKYQSVPTNIRRPDEVHAQTSTREIRGLFNNRNIRTHSTLQPCWTMNGPRSLRHTSDRTCDDRKRILSNMLAP